jgi:hypothetical protein
MRSRNSGAIRGAWVLFGLAAAETLAADAAFRTSRWDVGAVLSVLVIVTVGTAARRTAAAVGAARGAPQGWDRVRLEIDRARRQGGSLVVVRFSLATSPSLRSAWSLAQRAEQSLRGTDAVWCETRSLVLMLPGTDRDSAQAGIGRVVNGLDAQLSGAPVVVSFPEDVLTLGAMMDLVHPPRVASVVAKLNLPVAREAPRSVAIAVDADQPASA